MSSEAHPTRLQLFLAAVGEQILTYRQTAGLSQAELARRSGISAEAIDRIEHGWLDPTLTDVEAIACCIGVSIIELLDIAGTELGLGVEALGPYRPD